MQLLVIIFIRAGKYEMAGVINNYAANFSPVILKSVSAYPFINTYYIMSEHEQVITRFYTAFAQLDYKTMQQCYSNNAVFNDPVFGLLQGAEVGAMWEMRGCVVVE